MTLRSILVLLCAFGTATAQQPFSDGKKIHERTIFGGKAVISIPDDFSYKNILRMEEPGAVPYFAYTDQYNAVHYPAGISCYMLSAKQAGHELNADLQILKSFHSDKYHDVLREEFVEEDSNSYFYYECVLKEEFYSHDGKGYFEYEDSSMSPNYYLFYYALHNGIATHIVFHYTGKKTGLNDFRSLANQVAASCKWVKDDNH